MILGPRFPWSSLDIASKLLGTYEQELHPFLLKSRAKRYDCVVDIGCAEGYYAVWLGRLYENVQVVAYDINEDSRDACRENSILNNTTGILTLKSKCDTAELKSQCTYFKRPLVVCDCEGYELELFNEQATAAALSRSDVIIECHDFITAGTTETLKATFAHTHDVSVVYAGERNPNLFPFMQDIYDIDRWQAVCEHRPCVMNWIICESRQYRSPVSRVLRKLRLR